MSVKCWDCEREATWRDVNLEEGDARAYHCNYHVSKAAVDWGMAEPISHYAAINPETNP